MSSWAPKPGDTVSFRSNPEHRAVVAGYEKEKDMYNLVWIKPDGDVAGITITGKALQPWGGATEEQREAAFAQLAEQCADARLRANQADAFEAEIVELKKDAAEARLLAAHTLERVIPAEHTVSSFVASLCERLEITTREANEQIQALQASQPA